MRNRNVDTIDTLVKKIHFENAGKAELELAGLYGKRYSDYRQKWKLAGEFGFEPEFPIYLMMEQTFRCNLRCISCVHGYPDFSKLVSFKERLMPWELYERVVLEGEEHQCPSISTHNNDEPLLVKDLARRIAFARNHGFMDVIMTTNGVLFTEDKIKEIIDAGVTKILFSVDALTEETYNKIRPGGNLGKVLWALEKTLAYRERIRVHLPVIRVSFVPNSVNRHELDAFFDKYSEIVDYIDVQPFCTYYDNSKLIPEGSARVADFRCNAPWKSSIVRGNGDVLPCPNFYGAEVVLGNLYKNTLYEIFNSANVKRMRQDFKEGIYRHKVCKKCSQGIYYVDNFR